MPLLEPEVPVPPKKKRRDDSLPVLEYPTFRPPDVGRRVAGFDQATRDRQPGIVAYLSTTGSVSDTEAAAIGRGIGAAISWMDHADSFAGVPGGLAGMRLKALDIEDSGIRAQALDFVEAVRTLSLDQQQILLAIQQSQSPLISGPASAAAIQALQGTVVQGAVPTLEGGIELPGAAFSVDMAVAIQVLLPELDVLVDPDLYGAQEWDDFIGSLQDSDAVGYILDKAPSVTRLAEISLEIEEGRRGVAGSLLPLVGSAAVTSFEVGTGLLGSLGRSIGAEGITEDVAGLARQANEAIADALLPIVAIGLDPDDPDYQWKLEQRMGGFVLLTLGAGTVAVPAVLRRIRLARSVPGKEAAAAALRVADELRYGARGGLLGLSAEVYKLPLRKLVEQIQKMAVLFARDPEEWWRSGMFRSRGKRLTRDLAAAKLKHPDDLPSQTAFILEKYGTGALPERLIGGMLRQADEDGMRRFFVDYLTNPTKDLGELTATRTALDAELAGLEEAVSVPPQTVGADVTNGLSEPWRTSQPRDPNSSWDPVQAGEVEYVRVEDLRMLEPPLSRQPIDEGQVAATVERLPGEGFDSPIQIVVNTPENTVHVQDGNHRLAAAERLGYEWVPVHTLEYGGAPAGATPLEVIQGFNLAHGRNLSEVFPDQVRVPGSPEALPSASFEVKARYDRLLLVRQRVDRQISTAPFDKPLLRYPKRNVVRAAVRAPVTRIERMLAFLLDNKLYDAAKLVDELGRQPELHVPGTARYPIDGLERNVDVLSNYMRRAGVPKKELQVMLGRLTEARTQQSFYEVMEHQIFGPEGTIDRNLSRNIAPELRNSIINLHDSALEGRTRSWLHEEASGPGGTRRVRRPVLSKEVRPGEFVPRPSKPSDFLQTLRLPDVDLVLQADSFLRRAAGRLRAKGAPGAVAAGLVYDVPAAVLDFFSAIMKPLVMVFRLPAMAMRIQMEQALRSSAFGYRPFRGIPDGISLFPGGVPIPFSKTRVLSGLFGENGWNLLAPDPRFKGVPDPGAAEIGMFMSEMRDPAVSVSQPRSTLEYRTGRRQPKAEDYDAWLTDLSQANNDILVRQIVESEYDEAAVLRWLQEDPDAVRYMAELQQPVLDELGTSRPVWIRDQVESVRQLTMEHPDFERTILDGVIEEAGDLRPTRLPDGHLVQDTYAELQNRVRLVTEEIRFRNRTGYPEGEGPGYDPAVNAAEMAALASVRRSGFRHMEVLRREYGVQVRLRRVSLDDQRAARAVLRRRWEAAEWEMPETLTVTQHVRHRGRDLGLLDNVRQFNRGITAALYKPFRALSWVDKKGTRGSLFTQAYLRRLAELKTRGYEGVQAAAMARAHAGEVTRDLMYDLTARTSAQRALKDVFWFAPAWQEVLYTWAVKIPAESYWPVGALALVGRYAVIKQTLKNLGVVQEAPDGTEVIVVPGIASVVEKLTGEKVPEFVFGKLSGLNLVTSGGFAPGLSTPAGFGLGAAALRWGGPFKALSDLLQPYGPEASSLPTPVTYFWEAVFGEPPPWEVMSPELQKARWDQTFDTGIQYAFAELSEGGRRPPRPESFGDLQEDGTWTLSQDQETEYKKAMASYVRALMGLGERYARGMAFVRFLGSTVSPMALYTSSETRDEWLRFWESIVPPDGFGSKGMSDEIKQQINGYVEQYPESFAFTVFQTEWGQQERSLPFGESTDDAFYDDYLTGLRQTAEPRDYVFKLLGLESQRHYQRRTDRILDEISPSRDPWVLLTSGFERAGAIQAEKEAVDRWLLLNQEIDGYLKQQRAAWIAEEKVPVLSFEAERLGNTIDAIRQISPMLTGEEAYRSGEVVAVRALLQEMYSDRNEEFGGPRTPSERAMSWWFDNVMDPFLERTDALYQQAQELEGLGLDPAAVYNRIRAFSNSAPPKYKGAEVPSVEEVFFGNKSPEEQENAVIKWRTRPTSWLTNFQLDKVGIDSPVVRDFLSDVSEYDEQFWSLVVKSGISLSSDEYDRLRTVRLAVLTAAAQEIGPEAVEALLLNEAAPYVRLEAGGYGTGVEYWASTTAAAGQITKALLAAGLSPRGTGQDAVRLKAALYASIEEARDRDPQYYDELWNRLSDVMSLPNGVPRQGALLYEAVLFGNFNEDIPYALANIGGLGD